jgi:hypothetical protein
MAIKTKISKHYKLPVHTLAIATLALITIVVGILSELFILYKIW